MEPADLDATSAVVLGAVQGLTEFLPVSSSGHVAIGALLFDLKDAGPSLSIVLHLGTLVATLLLFRKDVAGLFVATAQALKRPSTLQSSEQGRTLARILLASIPTALIGLLIKDKVEEWAHYPWVVGVCLLVSAVLVLTTRRSKPDDDANAKAELSLSAALLVGTIQGIAVLPGISRSGSTIAAAMMLGMAGASAFRFSFLLSLPAVAGAALLLLLKDGALGSVPPVLWLGGLVALVVGLFALVALRSLVNQGRFWAFAIYLVPVGAGLIIYDLMLGGNVP